MNVDVHLMLEARNYATKLQRELNNSRKCHHEQLMAVAKELDATKDELHAAQTKLDEFQRILYGQTRNAEPCTSENVASRPKSRQGNRQS